jgi:hypothetical protein
VRQRSGGHQPRQFRQRSHRPSVCGAAWYPERNLCVLQLPLDESVNREVYDAQIEQPIWACIANRQAQDRILNLC